MRYGGNSYQGMWAQEDPELSVTANARPASRRVAKPASEAFKERLQQMVLDYARQDREITKKILHRRLDQWNRGEIALSTGDVARIGKRLEEIAKAEMFDLQEQHRLDSEAARIAAE